MLHLRNRPRTIKGEPQSFYYEFFDIFDIFGDRRPTVVYGEEHVSTARRHISGFIDLF